MFTRLLSPVSTLKKLFNGLRLGIGWDNKVITSDTSFADQMSFLPSAGPILESMNMRAIFHKKGKKGQKMLKKAKMFENLGKNVQNF